MTASVPLRYAPAGPVTAAFVASDAYVRGLMGPVGSGKSTACVFVVVGSVLHQRPSRRDGVRRVRWGVIRNTYPELRTTTIRTWHQWVSADLGHWRDEGPPTHRLMLDLGHLGRAELEVIFLALDRPEDVRKLLSLELTAAWINEAREVPKEVLSHLGSRVGRFPAMVDGGATWSGIIADTNPPDTDHWWYELFEEERPEGFVLFRQPSGRSAAAENRENLKPDYYARAALGQSKEWLRVYIDGEYGYSRDGKPVYDEFSDSLHVAPVPLEPIRGLPLILGGDAGLTPALAVTQRAPDGQWMVLDELVMEGGATKFGEATNRLLRERYDGFEASGWVDPAGKARASTDEKSWLQIVKAVTKLDLRAAPSNSPLLRQEAVRVPLTRLIDGHKPGLIVSPRCRVIRKGFNSGYRYRRMQVPGPARFEDKPEKNMYSHPLEALEYGLLGGGEGLAVTGRADRRRDARAARPRAETDYEVLDW